MTILSLLMSNAYWSEVRNIHTSTLSIQNIDYVVFVAPWSHVSARSNMTLYHKRHCHDKDWKRTNTDWCKDTLIWSTFANYVILIFEYFGKELSDYKLTTLCWCTLTYDENTPQYDKPGSLTWSSYHQSNNARSVENHQVNYKYDSSLAIPPENGLS